MKLLSVVANFDMEIKLHKASIYFEVDKHQVS